MKDVHVNNHFVHTIMSSSSFLTGILCQSFSPPSDEICPRDNVTFTCVVNSVVTLWTVNDGGGVTQCSYSSNIPLPDMCGPDGRFESSRTDVNGPANNSSLSVDLITNDLNGITVSCRDGGTGVLIGSYDICIIGKNIRESVDSLCRDGADACIIFFFFFFFLSKLILYR